MKLVIKTIENIKLALELTKKFILSREGIIFYLLLLVVQIPFVIQWLNILPLFLIGDLISPDIKPFGTELSTVVYLSIPIYLIFFILNLFAIGSVISFVSSLRLYEEVGIVYHFRVVIKKFKKLILAGFLILLLNFLISNLDSVCAISQRSSYNLLTSDLQKLLPTSELEQLNKLLVYVVLFSESFSRFGKPIIPISNEVVDLCIINGLSCIPSVIFNVFNLSSVLVLIISLIFIFIPQEVILTERNFVEIIRKSFNYFKNDFVEISVVWLISAFIFVIINFFISLGGYLIPIVPAYLGHVFAFLLTITFQTSYYLNFTKK